MPDPLCFGVVILAAGASSRMGQPKMLLPWRDTTILGHLVKTWGKLGAAQIGVVINPLHEAIQAELGRLAVAREDWIPNPNASKGMFSSIQAAACWHGWDPELTHFAVVLGDQPHLTEELLSAVLEFTGRYSTFICQPSRYFKGRHPVVFPKDLFLSLSQSDGPTLKHFLDAHWQKVRLLEWIDEYLSLNIDTPEDYDRAKQLFGASP